MAKAAFNKFSPSSSHQQLGRNFKEENCEILRLELSFV
jgi:hypothetical protein